MTVSPLAPLVLASTHPMITLEMADNRFDGCSFLQGFPKPGFLAVGMWRLSLLGNGHPFYTPSPAAVLLLLEGLVEPTIPGDFPGCFPKVFPDSGDDRTQCLHICLAVLIFHMGKNQSIVILGEGNERTKLTVGMTLALLDDGNSGFMERIDPILGGFAGENLLCLIDDSLSDRNQAIEFTTRFREASAVETVRYSGRLLYHMTGHLFEFPDRFFPAFRVLPVELLDSEKMFLADSTVGAQGFPEGYLLANPLDLFDDLLSNPMQEIGVRRIGDVLGLGGGIYRHPFGLHQSHL